MQEGGQENEGTISPTNSETNLGKKSVALADRREKGKAAKKYEAGHGRRLKAERWNRRWQAGVREAARGGAGESLPR